MNFRPRPKPMRQMLLLAFAALLPAALSAWLHPHAPGFRVKTVNEVDVASARSMTNAIWVDARSEQAFQQKHVPGAFGLPPALWDKRIDAFLDAWEPGRPVIVYCAGKNCEASLLVATRLERELAGHSPVYVVRGGWEALEAAR